MRGKARTTIEKHELYEAIVPFLKQGFSLKKACNLAQVPYSTMRDIHLAYAPLRAATTSLQNDVNVKARQNIIKKIEKGDVKLSQWWLERFDTLEPQTDPVFGGESEELVTLSEVAGTLRQASKATASQTSHTTPSPVARS